jgi:hypothetical protein
MTLYHKLFEGFARPPKGAIVVNPFARQGDILKWLGDGYITIAYDSEPIIAKVISRNCLTNRPSYVGAYVIANPPWTSKADSVDKTIFEQTGMDNLYKIFIRSLLKSPPLGGIIVVPLSFLTGTRDSERTRRKDFFQIFKPMRFNVFEERVFAKRIEITLCIEFKSRVFFNQTAEEDCLLKFSPSGLHRILTIAKSNYSNLPGENEFYKMYQDAPAKKINVKITDELAKSHMALDIYLQKQDSNERRAGLYVDGSRRITIRGFLSKKQQLRLAADFNTWLEDWRFHTHSLFLLSTDSDPSKKIITNAQAQEAIRRIIWSYYMGATSKNNHHKN